MNRKQLQILFIAFALVSFCAMLYHVNGFFHPTTLAPAWRHLIFIAVNVICIYGCLKKPNWFVWFIAILTLQQWYSHGGYAITTWQTQHIIHWISVVDVLLLPVLFFLLIKDKNRKQLQ